MENETNPLPDGEPEVEVVSDEQEIDDLPEIDEDGNPIEEPAPEIEEFEVEKDGQKFKLPKALEPLLMFQSDYTRKTQEIAEQRKALDTTIAAVEQANEQELTARATMVAYDHAIAEYANVDWDAWSRQDPMGANQAFMKLSMLKDQRTAAEGQYTAAQQQRTLETQQVIAKQIEQGVAELQRDIPGWGPEKAAALRDFGVKQYGFTNQDFDDIADARVIKLLHDAAEGVKSRTSTKAANTIKAQQAIKPAAKVTGGTAPRPKLDDRMSADAWVKQRNAQLAAKSR